jgi:glycosyltransferase involved in cell wall biosynthesis
MKPPEILLATVMRRDGGSGVQTHVRTVYEELRAVDLPAAVVDPFRPRSALRTPLFAVRMPLRKASHPAGVWWYRHWHGRYLDRALQIELARAGGRSVISAQCPVSAAAALRVRDREPVVMTVHFNISQAEEWADKGEIDRHGRLFAAIQRLEQQVVEHLDGLIYVSEFSRSLIEDRIPRSRYVPAIVVPNPIPACPGVADDSDGRTIADLITVGGLEPRKNHLFLLHVLREARRQGRHYTLSIVGDGPERANLERTARSLGVADQVTFWGYRADARTLMRRHRAYCHSARIESFGIVIAEAMAEGLPVLAPAVGGIPEVFRAGVDGQCWPLDDTAAAARVLVGMLDDESRRRAMATQAQCRAQLEFDAKAVVGTVASFLHSLERR